MLRRLKKQIISASILGGTILGLILITAFINSRQGTQGRTQEVTPTPSFRDIELEHVDVVRHGGLEGQDAMVDVVARLRNPNPGAGVASLDVIFTLQDTRGQEITHVTKTTYVLPGSLQYVMAFSIPLEHRTLGQVEVTFNKQPSFIVLPSSVTLPQFSAFPKERVNKRVGSEEIQEQRGIVKNTSTFDWGKVEVLVVGVTSSNTVAAIGQTFVGALTVGEEREFLVTWPKPSEEIDRLIILPSTNMYREDNIIQAVGNPGLLR